MIRRDMLAHKTRFSNALFSTDLEQAVPPSLLQFVCMVEHGADIKSQLQHGASKSDLALSQLLLFNCFGKYKEGTVVHRHSKDRETPFAVYLGMSMFAKTRKRQLNDILFEHGLSISYDRVLEISAQLGEAFVAQYVENGVVCPPALRKHLFTTAVVDNIDHNPTATTAQTSFHGTSLSIFQHPSPDYPGERRELPQLKSDRKNKKVPELPEDFTNVHPAYIPKKPYPPSAACQSFPAPDSIQDHLSQEYSWLEHVLVTENVVDTATITWSALTMKAILRANMAAILKNSSHIVF
ncbi:hypothetical protein Pcinc_006956 [Petrolisthes cinctipes]|uniref:Uncharacterized protein n=1 Tax=Petrolisthes cinctipes TaxID=88211 RepID=A0AAE1GC23_PETCI|nr:hypothetical protein Pcinc_006956 [Petrolisthes cinctipes]